MGLDKYRIEKAFAWRSIGQFANCCIK